MTLKEFKTEILPLKDKLYRLALYLLRNSADAEDVVQEVFIKIWKNREKLAGITNLTAWCMKVTRNLAIDKLRSKHQQNSPLSVAYNLSENGVSPHKRAELNDTMQRVKSILNELPENQRLVVQLREIEGFSYQEIADALEISLSQVKINLFRARQQLRTKLKKSESYGL